MRTIQTERALAWMMANKNKTPLPRHDDTTFYGDDGHGMSNGFDTDMYETCLERWEIEYESEDEKTELSHFNDSEDDGWYDELSWAITGETTSCVTSQTPKPSSHSVRARKKAERWDEFIVCITTRAAMFIQTTAALDQPLSPSVHPDIPANVSNERFCSCEESNETLPAVSLNGLTTETACC
jgi:hypothetical protein